MVTRVENIGLSPIAYPMSEPPSIHEARIACETALTGVWKSFVNESVRAATFGFKELDNGKFITLEDLERQINKKT